jgi:hypothetical protein
MAVHDIDVDPIRAGALRLGHLFAQTRKVGCKARRSQLDENANRRPPAASSSWPS